MKSAPSLALRAAKWKVVQVKKAAGQTIAQMVGSAATVNRLVGHIGLATREQAQGIAQSQQRGAGTGQSHAAQRGLGAAIRR